MLSKHGIEISPTKHDQTSRMNGLGYVGGG